MLPKAWNRTIELHAFADSDAEHGVRFELRNPSGSDNPPIEPGTPPRIVFNKNAEPTRNGKKMKAIDWHKVFFQLVDNDSLGLRFHDDRHQALWATSDAKCPTEQCSHKHFKLLQREDDMLTIRNDNFDVEEIGFTLNFLRPGDDGFNPATFIPCDPVGGNEDRGQGFTHDTLVGACIAGAGVATFGAAMLLSRMLKPGRAFASSRAGQRKPRKAERR